MSLKIQYCSDLHLEFRENKEFLKANPLKAEGDILLLAGDIVPFAEMNKHDAFFNEISDKFETVYWIPGNHEYYYFDAAMKSGSFNEKIRSNLFLVNNCALLQNNLRLIFSTLWSKISPAYEWQIERGMSDFQVIKYNGSRFSTSQFNQFHNESRDFIEHEITKDHAGKTIVVTHHAPTFMNYPEKYKGDVLSEAFAVELFDLIEPSNIDYWIYGHHHTNTSDFNIGNTKMLTNQLGYVKYNENPTFVNNKIIIID
ncbi:MAG: metallophosphoesterase [Bacteroidota bacterium]|nr:metallophosphoesterase [Bacteroidota bacterium]